jgi:hypothetical protein
MNRLIAYRSSEPERLRTVLRSHPGALLGSGSGGSDKTPVPGDAPDDQLVPTPGQWARWGVGFYVGGEALVQRWSDETARGLAAVLELRSDNLIAQVRRVGQGDAATQTSTAEPPFRFRRFTLAVQGDLGVLVRDRQARIAELPDFLRAHVRGTSAAETLFYQFLLRLHEADPTYLTRPELPAEVAVAALGQVLYAVAAASETGAPAQHVALSNGQWLVVARRGPQPLWYRALVGLGGGDDHFRAIYAIADAEAMLRAGESGMIELPDNYALMVGTDVDFQILPLSL